MPFIVLIKQRKVKKDVDKYLLKNYTYTIRRATDGETKAKRN